jgi:hypothetical protein
LGEQSKSFTSSPGALALKESKTEAILPASDKSKQLIIDKFICILQIVLIFTRKIGQAKKTEHKISELDWALFCYTLKKV